MLVKVEATPLQTRHTHTPSRAHYKTAVSMTLSMRFSDISSALDIDSSIASAVYVCVCSQIGCCRTITITLAIIYRVAPNLACGSELYSENIYLCMCCKYLNNLPNSVVNASTVNAFKARLNKFWSHQAVKFELTVQLVRCESGLIFNSQIFIRCMSFVSFYRGREGETKKN